MMMIQGFFREEDGGVSRGRGTLMVEERNGAFYDAESGGRLVASQFAITHDVSGISITSDKDSYHFDPDAGECQRIGLPVQVDG